jgi:hypothetical protein
MSQAKSGRPQGLVTRGKRRAKMAPNREDMHRAWNRINSFPTQRLATRFGTIEYADRGEGTPLLVSHGVLGSHADTVDGCMAERGGASPDLLPETTPWEAPRVHRLLGEAPGRS